MILLRYTIAKIAIGLKVICKYNTVEKNANIAKIISTWKFINDTFCYIFKKDIDGQ